MFRGIIKQHPKGVRICSECGKEMEQGYCLYDGDQYYCSDKCLNKNYSNAKYKILYKCGLAYYSEWGVKHE